jgi:1-deoxy-D-xylulose-5-phosphate synthase
MNTLLCKINTPEDLKRLSIKELSKLTVPIRKLIIEVVSKNGGHLASNLGVVELTLAIHYCFDTPKDKVIWDVGHQIYTHKIITGRKHLFHTLRQYKGISGFPAQKESIYDIFDTGHASCSISQALGLAIGRDINKETYKVIAIIGDGAISSGLAFEALNHAGQLQKNLIVVLNSNEMAISKTQGALAKYLNRLITQPIYLKFKEETERLLSKLPIAGKPSVDLMHRLTESIKNILLKGGILFEELGFKYIGPIDGHDIELLVETFNRVKELKEPVLVHVYTKKGKGYKPAEEHPELFHGTAPFNIKTGMPKLKTNPTYSARLGEYMVKIARENEKVIGITAAMAHGTGLQRLKETFPDKFIDVGIAEEHAVVLASGLAKSGLIPVVCIYSTFLQRAYDQIIHDIALQNLHVVFAVDRAGLVGEDGKTHHGIFDLAYLRHIPNIVIMSPKDDKELGLMLEFAVNELNQPVAIRYPKGSPKFGFNKYEKVILGKAEELKKFGNDLNILALGNLVKDALDAAWELKEELNLDIGVYNARFVKPLDKELILALKDKLILTVEEHVITAGFGSAVMEFLNNQGIREINLKQVGLPEKFIEHGDTQILHRIYQIDKEGIKANIKKILNTKVLVC